MTQRLTPIDILNLRFPRQFRGYSVTVVDEFLRQIAADFGHALEECAALRERNAAFERELSQYRALETTLRDSLVMAQKAADETRAAARAQAEAELLAAQARTQEYEARLQTHIAELTTHIELLRAERRRLARDLHAKLSAELAWVAEELSADSAEITPPAHPQGQIAAAPEKSDPAWLSPPVASLVREEE